jgi:ketosteroid isomerase-like protein
MTPDGFVERFVAGWEQPKPDGFVAYFRELSHPEVEASQPLLPTVRGIEAYMRSFRDVFALMPDFHPEVVTSAVSGDTVLIVSRVTATLGGRRIGFDVCDRFQLRDGLIYRRHAYFDPTPIVIGLLLRPWLLPKAVRGLRR